MLMKSCNRTECHNHIINKPKGSIEGVCTHSVKHLYTGNCNSHTAFCPRCRKSNDFLEEEDFDS